MNALRNMICKTKSDKSFLMVDRFFE